MMNTSLLSPLQNKKQSKPDLSLPLKRSNVAQYQFDPASPAKNLKNIFSHQNSIIDRLFSERDDLVDRVQALEERLSNSLSMIAVQKKRIVNLSDLSHRLSSATPIEPKNLPPGVSNIEQEDKLIVEQLLKLSPDQIPLYLAHNPFPLQFTHTSPQTAAERINTILNSLPPEVSIPFASAAFAQIFRSSEISELVQALRRSIHNHQFIHKIETFCCKLFKAGFCQVFTLQPQQNQLTTLFDNDGFTLQVPVGHGIVGRCAKDGKIMIFQSTQDGPQYDQEIDEFLKIGSNPSLLIPIFDSSSNFVISVVLVHTPKVGALFTPEDQQIGESLSSQISPFLTAYVEHMEKNEDRTYRNELSLAVKSLLGKNTLEELLQSILQVVQRAIKAENSELYLIDEEQNLLYVFEPQSSQNGVQLFVRKYFSSKSGIPFHVVHSLSSVNYTRLTPEKCEYFSRETDANAIGRPYIAVPVFAVGQTPIAVLAAYGKAGSNLFSPLDVASLQQIAVQVGVNLTNIFAAQSLNASHNSGMSDQGCFEKPLIALLNYFSIKLPSPLNRPKLVDNSEKIENTSTTENTNETPNPENPEDSDKTKSTDNSEPSENSKPSENSETTENTNSSENSKPSENPILLIDSIKSEPEESFVKIAEAVSIECSKRLNCDLVGVWQVIHDTENPKSPNVLKQRFIYKSKTSFTQPISVPPIVFQVMESGAARQTSVALEVHHMIGSFDDDIGYKSYSNITFPVKDDKGNVLWVLMAENSLSSQGRFSESDVKGMSEYSSFLLVASSITKLQNELKDEETLTYLEDKLMTTLEPVKNDTLRNFLLEICTQFGASFIALYQTDGLAESLNLIESNCEQAPKSITLTQGIIGKLYNSNESRCYSDVCNETDFNGATDAFGLEEVNSAIYCKLSKNLFVVLLSTDKKKFTKKMVGAILSSSALIEHAFQLSRAFNESGDPSLSCGATAEQRAQYMSRSSSPTRSDLEEFSERLFNVLSYNEDDRIIMILKMFVSLGVIRKLQVPFQKLVQFICTVRSVYNNDVPYHNWTHACDVTQFVFSCIMRGRLRLYLQDVELFALLLAAVCHDIDHRGLNNAFHKKAKTSLGILYDERPVMEMHHCSLSIRLLNLSENNVLEGIENQTEKCHFFEFFIKIILATDMDRHFAYIKEFEEIQSNFDKRNERHRLLLAQIVMKAGNVSNTTRTFEVASEMAHQLNDEYFKQGDIEKQLGIEVTQNCDRAKAPHISTSQVNFYSFIASPLLTALGNFIPALADVSEQLEKNKKQWEQQKEQWESAQTK